MANTARPGIPRFTSLHVNRQFGNIATLQATNKLTMGTYRNLALLVFPFFLHSLFAHAQQVTDVVTEQVGPKVMVHYTLAGEGGKVGLYVSEDGSNSWQGPLEKVSGDVGPGQRPGSNKTITWDVLAEREKLVGDWVFGIQVEDIKPVHIGSQIWKTKNLNVSKFRNGEPIPEARTKREWKRAGKKGKPAWCYYDNDASNGEKYGRLYNWYAVNDPRGLAPEGWHVPSAAEWTALTGYLGGIDVAGTKLKSTNGWKRNGNGFDASGFSGLPGGYRYDGGTFHFVGYFGSWWSSKEVSVSRAAFLYLGHSKRGLGRGGNDKEDGLSVRCIRD